MSAWAKLGANLERGSQRTSTPRLPTCMNAIWLGRSPAKIQATGAPNLASHSSLKFGRSFVPAPLGLGTGIRRRPREGGLYSRAPAQVVRLACPASKASPVEANSGRHICSRMRDAESDNHHWINEDATPR